MHDLLAIEELAQFHHLAEFNAKLSLLDKYLLTPTSSNSSTAKYARPDELFGKLTLGSNLSEDTPAGRLILMNTNSLLLSKPPPRSSSSKRKAFVTEAEDTGKNTLFLRLGKELVQEFDLRAGQDDVEFEVQFVLNRVPICEMHYAVDRLPDLGLVYPDVQTRLAIPWTPGRQWDMASSSSSVQLNPKQKEAIVAITTDVARPLPPILIIGPYGTGKTFTLGQSIKLLLKQPESRVLVCTHSNSAADLYIREYLHPYLQDEDEEIKLIRIYYRNRWVQTVHETVQKYCLIDTVDNARVFRSPTLDDVLVSSTVSNKYMTKKWKCSRLRETFKFY